MNCYLVLKSKLRLNSYCQGTVKWILMQSITDGWKKWKETMQLYLTAVINGKANNQKDTVLFFIISEKWRGPFGFWTLLCHFLVKDDFRYIRMENLHNAILLMPVFHKLLLVLCFSYQTLIIFLIVLSAILLYIVLMLLGDIYVNTFFLSKHYWQCFLLFVFVIGKRQ